MKRKRFIALSTISSVVWFLFMILAISIKESFGTWVTIGGIAVMFAWMAVQESIED